MISRNGFAIIDQLENFGILFKWYAKIIIQCTKAKYESNEFCVSLLEIREI